MLGTSFGPDLKGLSAEMALLRRPGFQTTLLTGANARRTTLLSTLGPQDVLHFATHARGPELWSSSGSRRLKLRQADLALADGGLTAGELQRTKLNARLVVLSGCETYVGRPVPLEAGYGALHRAVLAAGSEAVMASRWAVGDEATLSLMRELYSRLTADGRALALANAQRVMLKSTRVARAVLRKHTTLVPGVGLHNAQNVADIPYAAPWSWAGFTLVGRWD